MAVRKQLSKKKRFEIFKRDSFTCQYCGKTPPDVTLEIDHIVPVCEGGETESINLITACFDCNRGKGGNDLCHVMPASKDHLQALIEQEEQLKAYSRLVNARRKRDNQLIRDIEVALIFDGDTLSDGFRNSIRTQFIPRLSKDVLMNAAYKANAKCNTSRNAAKYFCGICWNIIKNKGFDE